jgi:hypothetical protein
MDTKEKKSVKPLRLAGNETAGPEDVEDIARLLSGLRHLLMIASCGETEVTRALDRAQELLRANFK